MEKEDLIIKAHVLLHPLRFRIVELLAEKPMHISAIAKAIGEDSREISFHLHTLEDYGFVSSEYEMSTNPKSRGKATRVYWVTSEVYVVIEQLEDILQQYI